MKKLLNCWEFMNCGRQPGGAKVAVNGVCPAATAKPYHGVNHGKNAGRFCWKVAGTMCTQAISSSFAGNFLTCLECPFFKKVAQEEDKAFR